MSVSVATSEDFKIFVKEATSISKEWKEAFNDEVTVVETKKYKESSLNSVRVSSVIEGINPMKLISIIYDPQYEDLFTKVAVDEQVLETIDENNIVHYCKLNLILKSSRRNEITISFSFSQRLCHQKKYEKNRRRMYCNV
jgi:hypothetical protein